MKYTIFFCLIVLGLTANAIENIKIFRGGIWETDLRTQFFRSQSNLTGFSNSSSLGGSNYYQLIDNTLSTRFAFSNDWSIYGGGNFAYGESNGIGGVRTNGSINQYLLGTEWKLLESYFNLIFDFSTIMPLDRFGITTNDMITNEGVPQYIFKLYFQKHLGRFFAFSYLGYNYRNDGRSALVPWGLGGEIISGSTMLGFELTGFQSVSEDRDSDLPNARQVALLRVNGGSEKFYSINPSAIDISGYGKFVLPSNLLLKVGGGMTILGNNYAGGFNIFAGLTMLYDFGGWYRGATSKKNSSYIETPLSSEKRVYRFQEDTHDGVDQRVFRVRPTQPGSKSKYIPGPVFEPEVRENSQGKPPISDFIDKEEADSIEATDDEFSGDFRDGSSDRSDLKIKLKKAKKDK